MANKLTEAAHRAARTLLLETLDRHGWRYGPAAEELDMTKASVSAALRTYAPEEYRRAKADGRITQAWNKRAAMSEGSPPSTEAREAEWAQAAAEAKAAHARESAALKAVIRSHVKADTLTPSSRQRIAQMLRGQL